MWSEKISKRHPTFHVRKITTSIVWMLRSLEKVLEICCDRLWWAQQRIGLNRFDAFWCTKPPQHQSSLHASLVLCALGRPESVQTARSTLRSLKASENNKVWSCFIKMPPLSAVKVFNTPLWHSRYPEDTGGSQTSTESWGGENLRTGKHPGCASKHRCFLVLLPSRSIASWRTCRKDWRLWKKLEKFAT